MKRAWVLFFWLVTIGMLHLPDWNSAEASDALADARQRMIATQLKGPGRSITNSKVLSAMWSVPRHEFVAKHLQGSAYDDHPLPIGQGQTISQPYIVAFMTQALEPRSSDRVLEVGTGSGYQAAVLAKVVGEVYSIEIVPELATNAAATLGRLGYTNVHVRAGDGYAGWPEAAPFDAVMVTCAPERVPEPLTNQLKEGGRMIIPVGSSGSQELVMLRKSDGQLRQERVLSVRFVPMTGRAADPP